MEVQDAKERADLAEDQLQVRTMLLLPLLPLLPLPPLPPLLPLLPLLLLLMVMVMVMVMLLLLLFALTSLLLHAGAQAAAAGTREMPIACPHAQRTATCHQQPAPKADFVACSHLSCRSGRTSPLVAAAPFLLYVDAAAGAAAGAARAGACAGVVVLLMVLLLPPPLLLTLRCRPALTSSATGRCRWRCCR